MRPSGRRRHRRTPRIGPASSLHPPPPSLRHQSRAAVQRASPTTALLHDAAHQSENAPHFNSSPICNANRPTTAGNSASICATTDVLSRTKTPSGMLRNGTRLSSSRATRCPKLRRERWTQSTAETGETSSRRGWPCLQQIPSSRSSQAKTERNKRNTAITGVHGAGEYSGVHHATR